MKGRERMKKIIAVILTLILTFVAVMPAYADNGKVTYSGNSGKFIFESGNDHSPTDLFPNFKNVMPGDSITQSITVKNNADDKIKVDIYIRSLGAKEGSEDFLSQMNLRVSIPENNEMGYMFNAAADQTAGLTDWVLLGTLYSGGEVNLDIILDVPVELNNEYSSQIGYLDWEFKVEEMPAESGDPEPPPTGVDNDIKTWLFVAAVSFVLFLMLIFLRKKERKDRVVQDEQ